MAQLDDVRLLIADTDPADQVFSDPQITQFLLLELNSTRNAAARALETHAAHIAQVAGPVRGLLDIRVGGEQSAGVLLQVARKLRGGSARALTLSNFEPDEAAI